MKLQQLKYLLAIVDNGLNITAAADRLYTSQPGVSKQLKLLEEELGMQLFARKGKSLQRITRAGEQVVRRARTIMDEVEQIRSLAADYYQEEEGSLTIAATNTQARYVLPELLRELQRQYPRVRLNLHQGTAAQIAEMMSGTDVDFFIASGSEQRFGNLLRLPGYQWDRVLLVPNDHELTKLDRPIALSDLARFPLVSYMFSFEECRGLTDVFTDAGLTANIVFTARDSDVIKNYVRMGIGVGIVAGMAYTAEDRSSLSAISVQDLFPRSTTWVGLRRNTMLRCYMTDFLKLFVPYMTTEQIERIARSNSQREVDQIVVDTRLPVRNGSCDKFHVAA